MAIESGPQVTPFLMFSGQAEEAMNFYTSVFEGSSILRIKRYAAGEAGAEGSVYQAAFSLNGREFLCIDSPMKHAFNFTPSISFFVTNADETAIERYFQALSAGGQVLMPLGEYPFSKKFGWVQDRFGVSWQLSAS